MKTLKNQVSSQFPITFHILQYSSTSNASQQYIYLYKHNSRTFVKKNITHIRIVMCTLRIDNTFPDNICMDSSVKYVTKQTLSIK